MKRQVEYDEQDGGIWKITCQLCPLIPAFEQLGMKPKPCLSGIATNMQGHIPFGKCDNYIQDSISNGDKKTLWLECRREDA